MATTPKITNVMSKIVELLTPLDSNERIRVVRAAMTLLGDSQTPQLESDDQTGGGGMDVKGLPGRAITWMRQQGLTVPQLEQVFHIQDGQVEVIASSVPGGGKKGVTINSYVLQGIRGLISSGGATFDDKSARQFCKNLGCYDDANHAINMKAAGNLWIGSKEKGWQLTAPGLKHGADLIKQMTSSKT